MRTKDFGDVRFSETVYVVDIPHYNFSRQKMGPEIGLKVIYGYCEIYKWKDNMFNDLNKRFDNKYILDEEDSCND